MRPKRRVAEGGRSIRIVAQSGLVFYPTMITDETGYYIPSR